MQRCKIISGDSRLPHCLALWKQLQPTPAMTPQFRQKPPLRLNGWITQQRTAVWLQSVSLTHFKTTDIITEVGIGWGCSASPLAFFFVAICEFYISAKPCWWATCRNASSKSKNEKEKNATIGILQTKKEEIHNLGGHGEKSLLAACLFIGFLVDVKASQFYDAVSYSNVFFKSKKMTGLFFSMLPSSCFANSPQFTWAEKQKYEPASTLSSNNI